MSKVVSTGVRGVSTGVRGVSTGVRGVSTGVRGVSTVRAYCFYQKQLTRARIESIKQLIQERKKRTFEQKKEADIVRTINKLEDEIEFQKDLVVSAELIANDEPLETLFTLVECAIRNLESIEKSSDHLNSLLQ